MTALADIPDRPDTKPPNPPPAVGSVVMRRTAFGLVPAKVPAVIGHAPIDGRWLCRVTPGPGTRPLEHPVP